MDSTERTVLLDPPGQNGAIATASAPVATPLQAHNTEDEVDFAPATIGKPLRNGATPDPFYPPDNQPVTRVYWNRFWILLIFSFLALFQCLEWNTWGPLNESVAAAYPGWGSETVSMMSNWGTITFVLFVVPMCWVMNTKGLRAGVLLCAALVAFGTVVRIVPFITTSTTFFTVMCHVCAICVGTAGTLIMAAPPLIAAVWFPPKERTTATAFGQMMNQFGNAASYLQPLMVREPSDNPSPEEVHLIQEDIQHLLYIWACVGMLLLIAIALHFPAKPPMPPSVTSHVERLDFKGSIKKMYRNRDLLLVTFSYGVSVGGPSAWASVLNYSLRDLGMDQDSAKWVGLAGVLVAGVMALLVGRLTDYIYGYIKLSLLIFMTANIACFYWFFLLSWGSIPVTTWQIYASVVGGLSFNFSLSPLFFELAVESVYPCSEVMVGGIITAANNLVGLIFLFTFLVPNIGYEWVTYVLLGSQALAIIPLIFVREDYSRSKIDRDNFESSYQPI